MIDLIFGVVLLALTVAVVHLSNRLDDVEDSI